MPELAINVSGRVADDAVVEALFYQEVLRAGLRRVHSARWATTVERLDGVSGEPVLSARQSRWHCMLARLCGGFPVYCELGDGTVTVKVAYERTRDLEQVLGHLETHIPRAKRTEQQIVPFTFWTLTEHGGPHSATRQLDVPTWDEIRKNYSRDTQAALDGLMRRSSPARGGQLILWTGSPGTGKTYAIRALAWEWRSWCRFHYVTDPEHFLGADSQYLMHLLLGQEGEDDEADDEAGENAGHHRHARSWWRLLLLEDTGEILSADAKERVGQALSRLLNVVDGLIGQGLRILVMITTNDEIGRLHPAVARPGRCAFLHEFDRLTVEEANTWLHARGARTTVNGPVTVAELYGVLAGVRQPKGRTVGFVPISSSGAAAAARLIDQPARGRGHKDVQSDG